MPTALIRSKMSRSRPDRSDSANHSCKRSAENAAAESASFHRLQISANTTIAASSNPTKRIMMVPTCWGCVRNGIGSLLSGRMVFMQETPKVTCTWSRTRPERFKARLDMMSSSQASGRQFPARSPGFIHQLLRKPSAARFHCATLSAIMRVDFIAAWLSWA